MKSDEFIREVDEELQRERLARLWKRFGPWLIVAAVLVVAGTAAKVGYESWLERRIHEQARLFAEAERRSGGAPDAAARAWLEVAAEADDGFAALARLRAAAAWNRAGSRDEAVKTLRELAAASDDPLLVDLARLLAAQYRIDTDDPATLASELEPLAAADRPFRHTAREMLAIAALRAGDEARARELLAQIADDATAPPGQQERVRELLEALGGRDGRVAS